MNDRTDELLGKLRLSGASSIDMADIYKYILDNDVEVERIAVARGGWNVYFTDKQKMWVENWRY